MNCILEWMMDLRRGGIVRSGRSARGRWNGRGK
jgi:hypothetical protein